MLATRVLTKSHTLSISSFKVFSPLRSVLFLTLEFLNKLEIVFLLLFYLHLSEVLLAFSRLSLLKKKASTELVDSEPKGLVSEMIFRVAMMSFELALQLLAICNFEVAQIRGTDLSAYPSFQVSFIRIKNDNKLAAPLA